MIDIYDCCDGTSIIRENDDFDAIVNFNGRGYKHLPSYDMWFDAETRKEVNDHTLINILKARYIVGGPQCYRNLAFPGYEFISKAGRCNGKLMKKDELTKYIIKSTEDSIDQFIDVPTVDNLLKVKAMLESLDNFGVKYDYSFRGSTTIISAMQSWNRRELMEILKNMKFTNMEKKEEHDALNSYASYIIRKTPLYTPTIKKIIVNDKTTIIIWKDNTKTIVRPSEHDAYDLEAAVCAAIAKKIYGTNSAFKRMIKEKVVVQENKKKGKKENNLNVSPTKARDIENNGFVSTKGEEDSVVYTGPQSLYNIDPNPETEGEE